MRDWQLRVDVDVPESRIEHDRLVFSVDGTLWDARTFDGVYLDPVTRTMMLEPLPRTAEWQTTHTGSYTRLRLADYTGYTSGKWAEHPRLNAGDWYMESRGVSEVMRTSATYDANRGFYISCHVHGGGTELLQFLQCGWGDTGTGVKLIFFPSGEVWVYKGGVKVGVYDLDGVNILSGGVRPGRTRQVAGETVRFFLIPCRGRELLVLSSHGPGFTHAFLDLDPNGSDMQEVTPEASFWWQVPEQYKASVSCAPLRYRTAGNAQSAIQQVRFPPETGATYETILSYHVPAFGSPAGTASLVDASTGVGYVSNGVNSDPARVKLSLTSDGTSTPFFYAADIKKLPTLTSTADAPFNLTPYLRGCRLSCPEKSPASIELIVNDPVKIAVAGLDRPTVIGDRPVRLGLEKESAIIDIFRGSLAKPNVVQGTNAASTIMYWAGGDREAEFALTSFRDTLPYDGFTLAAAYTDLILLAGHDPDTFLDVSTDTFTLPSGGGLSLGDWKLLPERGDTVAVWTNRLYSDFAETWLKGCTTDIDGYKFRLRRPDTLPSTPAVTLYRARVDATAAMVESSKLGYRTYRALRSAPVEAEANQIIVVGQDEQTREFVLSNYNDSDSQNPTLIPSARPANWRSRIVTYQLIEPSISRQESADQARDILADRLASERIGWEVRCDLLVRDGSEGEGGEDAEGIPVAKGDVIRLMSPQNGTESVDVRVLSWSCEFKNETGASGGTNYRDAVYQCEQIAEVLE